MKSYLGYSFAFLSVALSAASCSKGPAGVAPELTTTRVSDTSGPAIDAGAIKNGQTTYLELDSGAEIAITKINGKLFTLVEGTFPNDSFNALRAAFASKPQAERQAAVSREIGKVFASARAVGALPVSQNDEVGYFAFMAPVNAEAGQKLALSAAQWPRPLILNPVAIDRRSLADIKALRPANDGLRPAFLPGRDGTRDYSGLARIGEPEFVKLAEAAIGGGVKVDGSSINLGITDTGITYNHEAFAPARNAPARRVTYMRDFTREGRVYFHPQAKFTAAAGATDDELVLGAEIIATPRIPNLPFGDAFIELKGLKIKVSAELKAILLTPGSGAKLGVLLEDSLNSDTDPVDLNRNEKTNDKILIVLLPGESPAKDKVYVDFSATGDFRNVKPLGDFNATGDTAQVFAERIGFDLRDDKLPAADGENVVAVRSASIVGYDPGNHGSHVAGIAAGFKTIANDDDDTLARGVAPQAKILMNRVCANGGGCNATAAFIDLATAAGAEVINMSLGGLSPFNDGYGVQETMINRLTLLKNTLFVISAGNSGPGRNTVGSPSVARLSLSVGASASRGLIQRQYQWDGGGASSGGDASADDDFMLFFSSRGPTAAGGFKPNLAAPGTELSAIQLNAAPGARAGLDVYWGTSMAAPTAAGAYALFLDAVKKYNATHAATPLATDATVLRQVLIDSARPFDANRFDPATGARTAGQYSWQDQGTGLIDLPAAWNKLLALRDATAGALNTAVVADGLPVELDYQVLVAMPKAPNGAAYDGSRSVEGQPVFGTGLVIDPAGADTLRAVHIARRLPERFATGPQAGPLTAQLVSTADTFELRTVVYGSGVKWLKAGVLDRLGCADSTESDLRVVAGGAEVKVAPDGTGAIVPLPNSALNVCLDRAAIGALAPGDHGAVISAYRKVVARGADGAVSTRVSPVPSFQVPVSLTVPHKTLAGNTGYRIENVEVRGFGVSRNYVTIPKGASVVRVTLEVPAPKAGEECSGVELMGYEGLNVAKSFATRAEARISNCGADGTPLPPAKRSLTITRTGVKPGTWDLHVFGQYKYGRSRYTLAVDYVVAESSLARIEGTPAALAGSFDWKVLETSIAVAPDAARSSFELKGLSAETQAKVAKGEHVIVEGPLGKLRTYPEGASRVTITTGGSPGNDIDLIVLECDASATDADDASCQPVGSSGGSDDSERVDFPPAGGKVYAVRVDGYDIKDQGAFVSGETITLPADKGSLSISGAQPDFQIEYAFTAEQLAASRLLNSPLFTGGKYQVSGALTLRSDDGTVLGALPVTVRAEPTPEPAPTPEPTPTPTPSASPTE